MKAYWFIHRYSTMNDGRRPFYIVLKRLLSGIGLNLGMEWTWLTAFWNTPFHAPFAGMKFGRRM
jgi:hypothetical protein